MMRIQSVAVFCLVVCFVLGCKKYPVFPNQDPRSKGKRIARCWVGNQPLSKPYKDSLENTRVQVTLSNSGSYDWTAYTLILGVESAVHHQGKWKFIEEQRKLVLEENAGVSIRQDTFSIQLLNATKLELLPCNRFSKVEETIMLFPK
jgi:hypothetical protein